MEEIFSGEIRSYTVGPEIAGQRLDRYLSDQEPEISRSYLQKLIREGNVLLDGKPAKAGAKLSCGAEIELMLPEAKEPEILPEKLPLDILYEDSDVILINKPKGMVVHPSAGHYTGTGERASLSLQGRAFRHQRSAAPRNRPQNRQGYHGSADCLQK